MKIQKNLKERLQSIVTQSRDTKIAAFIGNLNTGVISVGGRANYIYVTTAFNGQVIRVRNNRVPNKLRLPVWVGYPDTSRVLQVIGEREGVYPTADIAMLPDHNHTWGESDNPAWIRKEQILDWLPVPSGGMVVSLAGGVVKLASSYTVIVATDFDFTSYIPATGAEWVAVSIDSLGAYEITEGSLYAIRADLQVSTLPTLPTGNILVFACKVYAGQTSIIHTLYNTDIFDPRMIASLGGGGGSGGAFQRVLTADLTLADGECLVVTGYLDTATYSVTLNGDSRLEIL